MAHTVTEPDTDVHLDRSRSAASAAAKQVVDGFFDLRWPPARLPTRVVIAVPVRPTGVVTCGLVDRPSVRNVTVARRLSHEVSMKRSAIDETQAFFAARAVTGTPIPDEGRPTKSMPRPARPTARKGTVSTSGAAAAEPSAAHALVGDAGRVVAVDVTSRCHRREDAGTIGTPAAPR